MKTLVSFVAAAGFAVLGADAASASYCSDQAKHIANSQAAGKTVVGAGLGCLFGKALGGKCGTGAVVGGGGGFLIGSAQWQTVYDNAYSECIGSTTQVKVKKVYVVPPVGSEEWLDQCDNKYNSFDRNTGYFTKYDGSLAVCQLP
jgi:hypothetical protein